MISVAAETPLVTTPQVSVVNRPAADDLERQVAHWLAASRTFLDAEEFASADAWRSVEQQVGLPLRRQLAQAVHELLRVGHAAADLARQARRSPEVLPRAAAAVQGLRTRYLQVETTLDFFGDAVNTRTSPRLRAALQNLDRLAVASMVPVLQSAARPVPPVLTYLDRGLGASILRHGIRLWAPGSLNPVAAVKIVRHNLYRPTSLFHETGHQVAHLTGWNDSLRAALSAGLRDDSELRAMWVPWASEITADVFAFVHTGFASVAALYDVVADPDTIFRWPVGDPHPVGWLRTLLGCAMCRAAYGAAGPWDALEQAVLAVHPATRAEPVVARLLLRSRDRLGEIAQLCLSTPLPGLRGRPVTAVLDPQRTSPGALAELERRAGPALWRSPHWRASEGIRLVALAGLREAEDPSRAADWADRARTWMTSAAVAA